MRLVREWRAHNQNPIVIVVHVTEVPKCSALADCVSKLNFDVLHCLKAPPPPARLLAFHVVAMKGELFVLLSSMYEDCILKSIANASQSNNCLPYGESTLAGDTSLTPTPNLIGR